MFLRYALLSFDYLFYMYDIMFGLLGLSQFSQNVSINAKGEIVGNIVNRSELTCFMVVIYGNIFYFVDILQIGCEGKFSNC